MHLFFTVKNSLVLLLIVYRLFVLFHDRHGSRDSMADDPEVGDNDHGTATAGMALMATDKDD
jgi:hypothetical protein